MTTDERIAAAFERIATAMEQHNERAAANNAKVNAIADRFLTMAASQLQRDAPSPMPPLATCGTCDAPLFPFGDGCVHFPPPSDRPA